MGMIWRVLDGRFPSLKAKRSAKREQNLTKLVSSAPTATIADGPRYLAATAHRTAGIGHVLSEWNTGLIVARELGLQFLHSSVNSPWEEFLGFYSGFENVEKYWSRPDIKIIKLPYIDWKSSNAASALKDQISRIRSPKPILFLLFEGQNSFHQHETGVELRKIYWNYRDRIGAKLLRDPDAINVSVHIRRRNAMDMKNATVHDTTGVGYKSRYLDLEYFEQLMEAVNRSLPQRKIVFNIFSQGDPAHLQSLLRFGDVRFRLSESEFNTFHNLAASDILITSPSSFSFKAGMLCPGLKLCRHPWWHHIPSDNEWCQISENPADDADRITTFIQNHISAAQKAAISLFSPKS